MHGKVTLITGAASGIGAALARTFAEAGSDVIGWDINETALKSLENDIKKRGGSFSGEVVDVTDRTRLRAGRDQILKNHRHIDIWINNAGTAAIGDFLRNSEEKLERMLEVNFLAMVWGSRVALETMQKQGSGTLVNMASIAGHVPSPYLAAYSATKHAVVGLTRSLRLELKIKSSPIKTLLVCPGFVDTAILAKGAREGFPEKLSWLLGKPELVANSVLSAVQKGKEEIYPTWNGKMILGINRLLPESASIGSSKYFLTR